MPRPRTALDPIPKGSALDSMRPDGTPKGNGWLGKLKMTDGTNRDMTEYSIGVHFDGKENLIPSIVPTLSQEEINHLRGGGDVTDEIRDKAVAHARERMQMGLSPFID